MEKLQQSEDVVIAWRSFELHPAGSPPMSPQHRAQIEQSRPRFEQMAREKYGLEVHAGPFGIDSRLALVADKYADSQGKGEEFHKATMNAYWQEAQDISALEVLKEIAGSVGLNIERFELALKDPFFDTEVAADVDLAAEYGLNGVPALVFADKYLVSGAQPYETLKSVVKKLQEEESA